MAETTLSVLPRRSPLSDGVRHLLRLVDRPVRGALELAAGPPFVIAGVGVLGAFLIASAATSSAAIAGLQPMSAVRAAFEALAIVIPSSVVLSAYARLRPSPAAIVSSAAIGLLTAGIVCWSLMPLVGFVLLASQGARSVDFFFQMLIPAVAVTVVALGVRHFLKVTDGRERGRWMGALIAVLILVLFAIRLDSLFLHVLGGHSHHEHSFFYFGARAR